MGLSRDTFYRYRDAVEDGGVEALLERPRRAPNLKNRVDLEGLDAEEVGLTIRYHPQAAAEAIEMIKLFLKDRL